MFHIRIRCAEDNKPVLMDQKTADRLLESVSFYQEQGRWFVHLFLLMPDHIHALLSFPKHEVMARVVGDWKRYLNKQLAVQWQNNFFDHRIRDTKEYLEKAAYIRQNPVVKGLCELPEDWSWMTEKDGA